ncbi:virulence factor TspB C-terminal domain-related protein [Methylophaga sp.]|uniref:virulence factor TspB C-terminal domain-related protein n=1 Tax=Methylophaga sp. TaxID=2024840 RepID=UPI0027250BDE|nr:virulence factor TspB C-terminal domain-related protein [Methylophaga sp.]MDO8827480.1 virulence factor TspB C-terminal domain-related protein [Methylophaga sp.]
MTRILLRIWLVILGLSVAGMAIGLLIFLTTGNAQANAVLQQPFQPTSINRMVSSSSLVTASTRFAGVTASNQSVYAVRAVEIGKASVANAIKTRSLTPWGIALVTALTAADYFYNPETQQWETTTRPDAWDIVNEQNLCESPGIGPGNRMAGISMGTCFNHVRSTFGNFQPAGVILHPTGNQSSYPYIQYCLQRVGASGCGNANFFRLPRSLQQPAAPFNPWPQPASNDQLFDFYRNLSPSQQADLLTDPYTGFPDAATIPEFQTAADQISSNWNANNDGNPDTVPNPDPTEQTSTEPFPEEAQEQDICKANPEILACQELGETPDETPIDEQQLPFDYQPVSFSGNASCPASIQMGGGIQYDYDAACSFASGVKPAVITMALLTGVFVMGGFRR